METLIAPIQKVIDLATKALALAGGAVKSAGGGISKAVKSVISRGSSITGKATGGGVQVGQSYMVGEKGPEMFTPASNGSITPNYKMAGAGGLNLTINMNGGTYLDDSVAERIGDRIIQVAKRNFRI
jgi:phage-related minor tail protein